MAGIGSSLGFPKISDTMWLEACSFGFRQEIYGYLCQMLLRNLFKSTFSHEKFISFLGVKYGCHMGKPTICIGEKKAQISFAVTAKLFSAFVFATQIVQFLYISSL